MVVALGAVAPPERCPPVGAGELRRSAQSAVDWFVRNQHADGTWLYLYDADDDSAPPEYNLVRHAGAAMGLYQAAAAGLPRALRSADRGSSWALHRLLERNGWAAFGLPGQIDTGATALLAAGLAIRRETTGEERYDRVLRRLGRFLLAQTEPSGAVLAAPGAVHAAPTIMRGIVYFATCSSCGSAASRAVKHGPDGTFGVSARTGRRVWKFGAGKYANPVVADAKRIYVTGRSAVFALKPRKHRKHR